MLFVVPFSNNCHLSSVIEENIKYNRNTETRNVDLEMRYLENVLQTVYCRTALNNPQVNSEFSDCKV